MSTDPVGSDDLFSFPQASKLVQGHPHVSTFHRWRLRGIRGVKLETVLVGGRRYVSRESLRRFCEELNAADSHSSESATARSRRREQEKAAAESDCTNVGL